MIIYSTLLYSIKSPTEKLLTSSITTTGVTRDHHRPRHGSNIALPPLMSADYKLPRLSPQLLITIVSVVEAMDLALVTASFKALEQSFGFSPRQLGLLQSAQALSFSLMLPVWGALIPIHGCRRLLTLGCWVWCFSTLLTPLCPALEQQLVLRVSNGAALSAVVPISQAILAEVVDESNRGKAFGLLGSLGVISKIGIVYWVVAAGENWGHCYYAVGLLALWLIWLVNRHLPEEYVRAPAFFSQVFYAKGKFFAKPVMKKGRQVCAQYEVWEV